MKRKALLKPNLRRALLYVFLLALILIWLLPMLFVILSSFKSVQEFYDNRIFTLPERISLDNFVSAWNVGNLSQYMGNGLIVSGIKVPLGILLEALTAFALTRLNFKHKTGMFVFFLMGMMIPMQVTLVPINIGITKLGLVNTYAGLILVYLGTGLPFGILVMRGFLRTIPFEIDESARLDGCTNLQLFWSIILPLAKPAISTLVILDFLSSWNEFLFGGLLITKDSMRTVPAGLMSFMGEHSTNYTLLCAGVLISVLPIIAIYLAFQRYFVEGMAGAIKG